MPSADAPRGRASWLMMGTGLVAMFSMAGWFWLAHPHTVVAIPPPPTLKQPATPRRYRQVIQEREGAQPDLRAEAERRVQDLVGLARR